MNIPARLSASAINPLMKLTTGSCQKVFGPNPFHVNEGTLPRTEQIVLQRGKHHR